MIHKVLLFVFLLKLNFSKMNAASDTLQNSIRKRSDINLQTCISNFDIHKDKIIRTQDSRDMGAKYLNEIDLGSREECLRLCCETDNCDVFVFEEKQNSGSCYLFNCGPPEDFKCKFTHHVNYSSAVLTINRHLPDLENQIKLTKHEQDLAKLRKPDVEQEVNVEVKPTTTTTSTVKNAVEISKIKGEEKDRKCSRYQFECRSSGECIAIYNACDGIPQCSDGSDEAPELGCPEILTSTASNSERLNPVVSNANMRYNQNNLHRPQQPFQEAYRPPPQQEDINPPLQAEPPHPEMDFIHPISDHRNVLNLHPPYESQQLPQYNQMSRHQQSGWIPHQSNQMPQQLPPYDKSVHIFNHKENGLQVPDGQETSQSQYGNINNNPHDYQKMSNYYEDGYRQHMPQEAWPNNVQDNHYGNDYAQPPNPREWIPQNAPEPQITGKETYKQPIADGYKKWDDNTVKANPVQQEAQKNVQTVTKDAITENKQIKIEKFEHQQHQIEYPHVVAYKMTDELQDGVAEAPGGAILSLTFGLIITCVMAILIGCRLRVVRRKMRKGGKSYAHDADYLVNGMYL